jgi:hypothetical protein
MSKWSNLRWARLEFVCTTRGTYEQGSDRSKFNPPKEYLYLSPLKAPGPQSRTFCVRRGPAGLFFGHHKTKILSDEGRPVLSDKGEKLAEVKNETDAPDPRERHVMLDQREMLSPLR